MGCSGSKPQPAVRQTRNPGPNSRAPKHGRARVAPTPQTAQAPKPAPTPKAAAAPAPPPLANSAAAAPPPPLTTTTSGPATAPGAPPPLAPSPAAAPKLPPPIAPPKLKRAPSRLRRPFHWTKLHNHQSPNRQDEFWTNLAEIDDGLAGGALVTGLDEHFAKASNAPVAKKIVARKNKYKRGNAKRKWIRLIDDKRAHLVSICLARFGLSHNEIRAALMDLDTHLLSADRLERLQEIMPSKDEIGAVRSFRGNELKLREAERFFMILCVVRDLSDRIEMLLFQQTFEPKLADIVGRIETVSSCLSEIRSSVAINRLFALILRCGNHLNRGTAREGAKAFHLDALLKLRTTKSLDNQTTLLHALLTAIDDLTFSEESNDTHQDLSQALRVIVRAVKVRKSDLESDLRSLENGLAKVANRVAQIARTSADSAKTGGGEQQEVSNLVLAMQRLLPDAKSQIQSCRASLSSTVTSAESLARQLGTNPRDWHDIFITFDNFHQHFLDTRSDMKHRREEQARKRRHPPGRFHKEGAQKEILALKSSPFRSAASMQREAILAELTAIAGNRPQSNQSDKFTALQPVVESSSVVAPVLSLADAPKPDQSKAIISDEFVPDVLPPAVTTQLHSILARETTSQDQSEINDANQHTTFCPPESLSTQPQVVQQLSSQGESDVSDDMELLLPHQLEPISVDKEFEVQKSTDSMTEDDDVCESSRSNSFDFSAPPSEASLSRQSSLASVSHLSQHHHQKRPIRALIGLEQDDFGSDSDDNGDLPSLVTLGSGTPTPPAMSLHAAVESSTKFSPKAPLLSAPV